MNSTIIVKISSSEVTFESHNVDSVKLTFPDMDWLKHDTYDHIVKQLDALRVTPVKSLASSKHIAVPNFINGLKTFKIRLLDEHANTAGPFEFTYTDDVNTFTFEVIDQSNVKTPKLEFGNEIVSKGERKSKGVTGDIKIAGEGLKFNRPDSDRGSVDCLLFQLPIFKLGDLPAVINHSRGLGASLVKRPLALKENLLINISTLEEGTKMQKGLPYVITYMLASMFTDDDFGTRTKTFGPFTITVNLALC